MAEITVGTQVYDKRNAGHRRGIGIVRGSKIGAWGWTWYDVEFPNDDRWNSLHAGIPNMLSLTADDLEIVESPAPETSAATPAQPTSKINKFTLAQKAQDEIETLPAPVRARYYEIDAWNRIQMSNGMVRHHMQAEHWTEAQAQWYVLNYWWAINYYHMTRHFMSDFSEKMKEELSIRLGQYGDKAYPLSKKQFEAAVRVAW